MCKLVDIKLNDGTYIKVADIKKRYIENIISSASKCKQIDYIILFGSALEERCTDESDIDIAIISKYTIDRLSKLESYLKFITEVYDLNLYQEYDRLYFKSLSEIEENEYEAYICKELIQKGKIIYKKAV